MRLEEVILVNYRSYSQEVRIPINDITAFIGKNDVGKTTILEALDTFFNQSKLDPRDKNIFHLGEDTIIGCVFSDLPSQIVLDETVSTSLSQEYLLNGNGWLEIRKNYGIAGKESVWIFANHPSNDGYSDLLSKKNSELKAKIRALHLEDQVNLAVNSEMRHKLWEQLGDEIVLSPTLISADQADEKKLWPKIQVV
jgi:predicted ATP-dependent endonuclease of OLD family